MYSHFLRDIYYFLLEIHIHTYLIAQNLREFKILNHLYTI